jgi:hypothetical protein
VLWCCNIDKSIDSGFYTLEVADSLVRLMDLSNEFKYHKEKNFLRELEQEMTSRKTVSNQSVGYLFSGIFFLSSIYLWLMIESLAWALMFSISSLIMMVVTRIVPGMITPLNKSWMALGHLLGSIVSPIILGLIFFVLISPVALIGRIAGRDPLRLKTGADASYWIKREPPGPAPDSFKNQF